MVYLFGKNLNNKSLALYGVIRLYGLGFSIVQIMFNDLCIGLNCRIKDLNQSLLVKILKWVEKNKVFMENVLVNKINTNINRFKILKNRKSIKHSYNFSLKKLYVDKKN